MHYNYMTAEQWRIWRGVSHRFPMWDKEDKHSVVLLQEQTKPWAVSCAGLDGRCCSSPAHKERGASCGEAAAQSEEAPGWGVCAGLPENVLIARGSLHTPAALSGGQGSCCLFFQGSLRAGGNKGGLNWISPLFLDCCGSSETCSTEVCFGVCVAGPQWPPLVQSWHPGQGNILLRDGSPEAGRGSLVTGAASSRGAFSMFHSLPHFHGRMVQKGRTPRHHSPKPDRKILLQFPGNLGGWEV